MTIGSLSVGARGFDANAPLTAITAKTMKDHGYQFVIRYVRRNGAHDYDISSMELERILAAGLALMLVQHVAIPGWLPSATLGKAYGLNAADHAKSVGYQSGATLWCDLEGVAKDAHADAVAAYCNEWYGSVAMAGYQPGLYVGDSCGLNPAQLYALKFQRYWSAYNLNADDHPAVRGVCMRQLVAKPADLAGGYTNQTMDVDVIVKDAKDGTPTLVLP